MPSTFGGFLLFVVFLSPGFLNYLERRKRVPQRQLSPLVEVASFVTVSIATSLITLLFFSFLRWSLPTHTPNVTLFVSQGLRYVDPRVGYIFGWAIGMLAVSCALGVIIGRWPGIFGRLLPVVMDVSAWYQVFENVPKGSRVFVGCDLRDGTYVSGYLDWYNTDVDEVADRDLVLMTPIKIRSSGIEKESEFTQMIVSARDISRLNVSYVTVQPPAISELM